MRSWWISATPLPRCTRCRTRRSTRPRPRRSSRSSTRRRRRAPIRSSWSPRRHAKSWTRSVALPLFVLAAAIGHGAPALRGPPVAGRRQRDVRPRGAGRRTSSLSARSSTRRRAAAPPRRVPHRAARTTARHALGAWFRAARAVRDEARLLPVYDCVLPGSEDPAV